MSGFLQTLALTTTFAIVAAPALAQEIIKCQTAREADGLISQMEAVLNPQFDRLLIQQGPMFTDLTMSQEAPLHPGGSMPDTAQLYLFWVGGGVAGKDWREPGGTAFALGGFALRWPDFLTQMGGRIDYIRTVITMGEAKFNRDFYLYEKNASGTQGQTYRMHEAMQRENPNYWDYRDIEPNDWPAWRKAFEAGGKMTVELRGTRYQIATATFDVPPLSVFMRRAGEDIREFRAKADPAKCPDAR